MNIFNIIKNLTVSDWIQIAILLALIWYSLETRTLRRWQKKQSQLTLLQLDMQRVKTQAEFPINPTPYGKAFPTIIREIYELGKFDPKVLYSKAYHQPLKKRDRVLKWITNFKNKIIKNLKIN